MSTIQDIFDALSKTADDKKKQLDVRYSESSLWLQSEFDIVRNLIERNPRDSSANVMQGITGTGSILSSSTLAANIFSPTAVSMKSENQVSEIKSEIKSEVKSEVKSEKAQDSKKRTFPKAELGSSLLSPEQKRQSADATELQVEAGLPADLNRLTKDQLIRELENRSALGSYTKQFLKKDLIEGLKNHLIEEYRRTRAVVKSPFIKQYEKQYDLENDDDEDEDNDEDESNAMEDGDDNDEVNISQNNIINEDNDEEVEAVNPNATPKPVRKGSLMADFRTLVNKDPAPVASTDTHNDEKRKSFIESEFKARQARHRSSVANKLKEAEEEGNEEEEVEVEEGEVEEEEVSSDAAQPMVSDEDEEEEENNDEDEKNNEEENNNEEEEVEVETTNPSSFPPTPPHPTEEKLQNVVQTNPIQPTVQHTRMSEASQISHANHTWNEVASPAPNSPTPNSPLSDKHEASKQDKKGGNQDQDQEDIAPATVPASTTESEETSPKKSSVSPKKQVAVAPATTATANAPPASVPAPPASSATAPSVQNWPVNKKLNNLVVLTGGQTSFLDSKPVTNNTASFLDGSSKGEKPKPVAAILKAQQLRAAEELKAKNKLLEKEAKAALIASNKSKLARDATKAAGGLSKPSVPTQSTTTSNAPPNPLVKTKSGGILSTAASLMGFKKNANGVNVPVSSLSSSSASSATGEKATTGSSSSNFKSVSTSSFDISVVNLDSKKVAVPEALSSSSMASPSFDISGTPGSSLKGGAGSTKKPVAAAVSSQSMSMSTSTSTVSSSSASSSSSSSAPAPVLAPVAASHAMNKSAEMPTNKTAAPAPAALNIKAPPASPSPSPMKAPSPKSPIVLSAMKCHSKDLNDHKSASKAPKSPYQAALANQASAKKLALQSGSAQPTQPVPAAPAEQAEYQIVDGNDSDDSGSGTDDEGESNTKKQQQNIPDWARGDLLKKQLAKQYGLNGNIPMDPDSIFHEVSSCNLEEIFGRQEGINRKYNHRSSSAHWEPDQITLVEKRAYRKHMGYAKEKESHAEDQVLL